MQDYASVKQLPNGYPQRQPEPPGVISELLAGAAVRINGDAPWDIQVYDEKVYRLILTQGSLGLGRAYMEGLWDSDQLDETFHRLLAADIDTKMVGWARVRLLGEVLRQRLFNLQSPQRAFQVAEQHYDIGNDVFESMLDSRMIYSCAYWEHASSLEQAQQHKLDMICRKLQLQPGERLLEIGCGWGGLAGHLADRGAEVDAISLSDAQLAWARRHHMGPRFLKQDYRDTAGSYDGIVSVEMVEALGREYWPTFMDCVARNLKPGGRAAIQFISIRDDLFDAYAASADFIQAYIFPGGLLIRTSEFRRLAEARGLAWQDQVDFGPDYAETLKTWRVNFNNAVVEGCLPPGFDARFVELWRFYLLYCEGGFRGGGIDVHQVTLVKRDR